MSFVTLPTSSWHFETIYLSGSASPSSSSLPIGPFTASASSSSPSRSLSALPVTNLHAFHSLFAKALFAAIFSMFNGMSCPGVTPVTSEYLRLSAPYSATVSRGSTTLPFVFDILLPSAARTSPCRYMTENGLLSVSSIPSMTILATQKKRMSYPVSRHVPG